jgi:hypothetical protein
VNLWDAQPGESAKDYSRFQTYLSIPPAQRSWAAAARLEGCSPSTMRATGTKNDWRERAAAHDRYIQPAVTAEITADRAASHRQALESFRRDQEMRARRLERLAGLMQGAVAKTLLRMAKRNEAIPAQCLGSFAAAAQRIDESASNARAELLGLHELLELLPQADDFADHLLPGD